MLVVACVVLGMSCLLDVRDDQRVAFSAWKQLPLPPMCLSRSWFGVACPGCGLTRSFAHLAHGRWEAAWETHHLGWLLAVSLLFQIPYRVLCLLSYERYRLPNSIADGFGKFLITALIGNWLLGFF